MIKVGSRVFPEWLENEGDDELRYLKQIGGDYVGTRWDGPAPHHATNISSGRKADTTKFGTSTTSLIFRSTATLHIQ